MANFTYLYVGLLVNSFILLVSLIFVLQVSWDDTIVELDPLERGRLVTSANK